MPAPDTDFPYHRIAADIREAITSGRLEPGARLPSEWALAEQYGTSRPTVRRAVAVLKAEMLKPRLLFGIGAVHPVHAP